jgi:hypothetical protein
MLLAQQVYRQRVELVRLVPGRVVDLVQQQAAVRALGEDILLQQLGDGAIDLAAAAAGVVRQAGHRKVGRLRAIQDCADQAL